MQKIKKFLARQELVCGRGAGESLQGVRSKLSEVLKFQQI